MSSVADPSTPYRIEELLPHEPPMRWLDRVIEIGDDYIVAAVDIRDTALLHEANRGVPAWVGIEYMAQAANAYSGYEDRAQGRAPRIGLLLGCRRFACDLAYFATGSTLVVRASLTMRDENDLVAFDCRIEVAGEKIASCDLKAIRPNDLKSILARAGTSNASTMTSMELNTDGK